MATVQTVKHTPGPWVIKRVAHSRVGAVRIVDWATHLRICEIRDADGEPSKSDARLIAAAPDLLAACKFFVDAIESRKRSGLQPCCDFSDWDTVAYVVRNAIAKAKGGDPCTQP